MADELSITINIAGRPYRLIVVREEEEEIRRAAKSIETQMNIYAGKYTSNDKQDLLAMAALHFATLSGRSQEDTAFIKNELHPTLTSMDQLLTEQLKD